MPRCAWFLLMAATICLLPPVTACTGIRLTAKDGSIVYGRTLEFGTDLQSNIIVIPRGKDFVGSAPDNQPGLPWITKYATAGVNAFGLPVMIDGVNEAGLAVGIFYFPGYARYQSIDAGQAVKALAPWELATYLLTTCANVDEAVAAAKTVFVTEVVQPDMGFVPPCHYIVHDKQGQCRVLEYVNGQLTIHDNRLGVFTNAPTFDWHMTNLRNYASLSVVNTTPVDLLGMKLSGFGQGNGLVGLPGDFTPPSRFVRAVAFSQSAPSAKTARDAVLQTFHILNQFDIPKGSVRGIEQGQIHDDYTLWTSAADITHARYYFHTYANRQIRMVDLHEQKLTAPGIKTISMSGEEEITELSRGAE